MAEPANIAVIYYSATGNVHGLAQAVAEGAEGTGAEVRLRHVEELASERPGMPIGWMPELDQAVRFLARRARPGDVVLTIGAGDVEQAAPMLLEELA